MRKNPDKFLVIVGCQKNAFGILFEKRMVIVTIEINSRFFFHLDIVFFSKSIDLCCRACAKRQRINFSQVAGYDHGALDV